jgi:hypothetical protein
MRTRGWQSREDVARPETSETVRSWASGAATRVVTSIRRPRPAGLCRGNAGDCEEAFLVCIVEMFWGRPHEIIILGDDGNGEMVPIEIRPTGHPPDPERRTLFMHRQPWEVFQELGRQHGWQRPERSDATRGKASTQRTRRMSPTAGAASRLLRTTLARGLTRLSEGLRLSRPTRRSPSLSR